MPSLDQLRKEYKCKIFENNDASMNEMSTRDFSIWEGSSLQGFAQIMIGGRNGQELLVVSIEKIQDISGNEGITPKFF